MSRVRMVVSVHDPAVDFVEMDSNAAEWIATRDPALLRTKPGMRPVLFHIEPCDVETFYSYVRGGPTPEAEYKRAFEVCVKQIDGLGGRHSSQVRPGDEARAAVGKGSCWSKRDIAALEPELSSALVEDIGTVAWYSVFFCHLGNAARSPLAQHSRDAVTARILQCVAEIRARLTTQSNEQTSPPDPSTSAQSDGAGGSATAVDPPADGKQSRSSRRAVKR